MYTTRDNKIFLEDQEIRVRGVSRPGLEYLYVDLPAMIPETIRSDLDRMKEWGFNCVRLPLRDKHWFENSHYREMVDFWVQNIRQQGMISLLDLHNQGDSPALEPFLIRRGKRQKDALLFWEEVSKKYGGFSDVWFEMYNEPHDVSPDIWWNGNGQFYGYKDMLSVIRKNSQNICIMGGLDWAYEWGFLPYQSFFQEVLSQTNLVLSTHPYGYRGKPRLPEKTVSEQIPTYVIFPNYSDSFSGDCSTGITIPQIDRLDYGWNESFGFFHVSDTFPVIATEFGLDRPDTAIQGGWYITELVRYFDEINMGFVAWAWVQDRLDYPSLLTNEFLPTGMALKNTQGPACSARQNWFYPGPGNLVKTHLSQQSFSTRRQLFTEQTPRLPYLSSSIIFFPLFFLLGKRWFSSKKKETTSFKNSLENGHSEECPTSRIFSDCQLRNRSSTSLI